MEYIKKLTKRIEDVGNLVGQTKPILTLFVEIPFSPCGNEASYEFEIEPSVLAASKSWYVQVAWISSNYIFEELEIFSNLIDKVIGDSCIHNLPSLINTPKFGISSCKKSMLSKKDISKYIKIKYRVAENSKDLHDDHLSCMGLLSMSIMIRPLSFLKL